jgi:hypothetical protein
MCTASIERFFYIMLQAFIYSQWVDIQDEQWLLSSVLHPCDASEVFSLYVFHYVIVGCFKVMDIINIDLAIYPRFDISPSPAFIICKVKLNIVEIHLIEIFD